MELKLTGVSLFSGAGGMDTGFESAGVEILFANEIDPDAAQAWRLNRPGREAVMAVGDVQKHLDELKSLKGADIVFGGPPCQGFSVAGKMDPKDPRSQLIFVFLKAVDIVHPKVFVMENVAALGRLERWDNVRVRWLKKAADLGYDVDFRVWTTSEYGVPQKRERVLALGVRKDAGNARDFASAMELRRTEPPVARTVLLAAGRYGTAENPDTCPARVTLAKNPVMRASPYAGMLVNGAGRPVDLDDLPPTLPATMGGNKTPIVDQDHLDGKRKRNWFEWYHSALLAGRKDPEEVTPPASLRRLTLKEAALVQTFPEGYRFAGPKTTQYKEIGNAVPCRFAEVAARSLIDVYF